MARADSPHRSRVLIIDGHEDSREMYATFLRLAGFDAMTAANADGAVEHAARSHVDVIVTEIQLQGTIDGLEMTRRLRADERTRRIPVIVLSATAGLADRDRADSEGCDVFLTKPCEPAALAFNVRLLIAERVAERDRTGSSKIQAACRATQGQKHATERVDERSRGRPAHHRGDAGADSGRRS